MWSAYVSFALIARQAQYPKRCVPSFTVRWCELCSSRASGAPCDVRLCELCSHCASGAVPQALRRGTPSLVFHHVMSASVSFALLARQARYPTCWLRRYMSMPLVGALLFPRVRRGPPLAGLHLIHKNGKGQDPVQGVISNHPLYK